MICNRCGAQLRDGSTFCPTCGSRISNTGYYGYSVNDGSQGTGRQNSYYTQPAYSSQLAYGGQAAYYPAQYGAYASQPEYAAAAPAKKRKSKLPLVLGTMVAMVAVAAVVIVLMMHTAVKPYEKAVDDLFTAINTGNYNLLEEVTVGYIYDDLAYAIEDGYTYNYEITGSTEVDLGEMLGLSEYQDYLTFLGLPELDEVAAVSTTVDGANVTFYVCKMGGNWKVLYYE